MNAAPVRSNGIVYPVKEAEDEVRYGKVSDNKKRRRGAKAEDLFFCWGAIDVSLIVGIKFGRSCSRELTFRRLSVALSLVKLSPLSDFLYR